MAQEKDLEMINLIAETINSILIGLLLIVEIKICNNILIMDVVLISKGTLIMVNNNIL